MNNPYQLGDIIIFKAEDDIFSKCIAWLTDSDVSHSAMIYTEDSITEMIAPGAVVNKIQTGKGEAAYLLRLTPPRDPRPLLNAAEKYLNAKTQYNFPALLYLGGLLLFKRIRPTKKLLCIAERIMTLACLELDKLLQKLAKHPENRSMVCSQYVYQVYYDCGKEYQIQIHSDRSNRFHQQSDTIRLFDFHNENLASQVKSPHTNLLVSEAPEELMTQLYEALSQSDLTNVVSAEHIEIQPVIDAFCEKLQLLMGILRTDMPIDSLFVTPADFVYHAENLENRGEILMERIL